MQWTTACLDWESRLLNRQSIIPAPLFPAIADRALAAFKNLRAPDIAGQPKLGDICRPWVFDLVAAIFGSYDRQTNKRLIKRYMLLISKKNGKSTFSAAIMLVALVLNNRPKAEMFLLGPTKDVAKNAWNPLLGMIQLDPVLQKMLHVQPHQYKVTHRASGAVLQVIAADSSSVSGKKSVFTFIDEIHEFGKMRNADNVFLEITGGLATFMEGFVIYSTTQSEKPPAGVFKKLLHYARDVRDGKIKDNTFLPILYEFPKAMVESEAYLDIANAYITNPNLGASVDEDFLRTTLEQEKSMGREALDQFCAKHLNVEVGLNRGTDSWVGADLWEPCAKLPKLTLDELLDKSEIVTIGIDGGGLDDLLAICVLGRSKETINGVKPWLVWVHAWAAEVVYERRKAIVPILEDFECDGDLTKTTDTIEALEQMADICVQVKNSKKLHLVGLDNYKAVADALEILNTAGIEQDEMRTIHQGAKLMTAIVAAEGKLASKTMWHSNQALLNWSIGNAKVEPRGNAIMITKQAAGTAKIDAVIAMLNAVQLMADNPQKKKTFAEALKEGGVFIAAT